MLLFQVGDQARNLVRQPGQPPQQADHDTGRCGDRDPPPVPAEPARIESVYHLPPTLTSQEHQAGDRADNPQGDRVGDEDPEFPRLGERR
jgi:hypothetical protein